MRIERRYTKTSGFPYAEIEFRSAKSEIRNPDGSVVFRTRGLRGAGRLEPGGGRRSGPEIFPQGRRPGAFEEGRGERRPLLPLAFGPRRGRTGAVAGRRADRSRDLGPAGLRSIGRHLGVLGLEGQVFSARRTTLTRSTTSCASCWPARWWRRTRRNGSIPASTGPMASTGPGRVTTTSTSRRGELTRSTSAYEHPQPHACFIQSVQDDLVNEGGIMDLWVREARLFKYGSGTGTNFSRLRGEKEKLSGGGKSSGPDELPEDRRPCGRCHQIGRHHAPRRQDGRGRCRPSGYRELYRLEGEGGGEGRGPRDRLQDHPPPSQGRAAGLPELPGIGGRLFHPREEPGPEARDQGRPAAWRCRTT